MKADFINILNELKMNSVLMKEIDLETMLTLLKNHDIITDQEEHKLLSKGPVGRYVSGSYDHSLTRTSFPLSKQAGRVENLYISVDSPRILQELVGTILPKKDDEYMKFFIESLKIAGFTQSYEFVRTGVNNVRASGAGVVATGAGVAPGEVSPVNVTSSDVRMKLEDRLMEAQEHLSTFIKQNVDSMADFWSGRLHLPNTWSAFVDVQVLEDFQDDRGKVVPSGDYMQMFENVSKTNYTRILIQGDPGCGKSTYVNKVALDWANENEYLRNKFHLVFLISLQTLNMSIEQAIRALLPQPSNQVIFDEGYYKRHSSKVLLIMDGFDEFPEDSQFYPEVMNMMKGDLMTSQYSFFTIIVTTRRSHVDKLPKRFHARSLLIKGFDEQSMKLFLQTQKVPTPDEQTDPNLVVLLQNPFFCTIYCSLHYFGVDKSNLEDPYDFVKALVESTVEIEKDVKRITDDEDQLLLLGAFAFQKLNSETLNVVKNLFPMRETFLSKMVNIFKKKPKHVQRIDTDKIQLGLLIKKKIPAVVVQFKAEFSFPHQLIAEYLAARYFITSTKSQLKQLQPEKLVQGELSVKLRQLILSSPSSLPFVRFLLFEYLNSHLHDARNGRELIFRFLTDEFRFICYCKSKSETPTTNDITSLDCKKIDSEIRHGSRFFPTLAKCNQLKSLGLANCYLSTNEANELVKLFQKNCLPKLMTLNFSNNRNVGSTPALITALGKCKQLETLDLQNCYLSIESINRLTTCIDAKCWLKISQLDLSSNRNVGSTSALFTALCNCKQLERLELQNCDLSSESVNGLTTCINDNCWGKLSQLNLSRNSNVGSTPALIAALGNCKQLERLELQNCDLSIESINRFSICIDDNCWGKLSQLKLSKNINVGTTPALIAALGNSKQLERLELQNCDLLIESINQLLTCVDDNCWVKLSQLSLSWNSDVGLTPALLAALGKCKQLERIDLQNCYLSIEAMNRLTTCINDNCWVKLSQLSLSYNSNVGSTPALLAALGKCKQLERLGLQRCDLSFESINRLTTCIEDKCWLKISQLDLSSNRNVGSTSALIAALGNCKQLERLELENCDLSSESINGLTTCINDNCWGKLSQLSLSRNRNVGSTSALFTALCNCKQLERLELQNCDLSSESLNRLTTCINDNCWEKLSQLNLSRNSNVGSTSALIAALGNCKHLERLELENCDLSSELINRLTTCINDNCWVKLSQLSLSYNSNVGSTPALLAALGKCKQLERLGLQRCDLSFESINRLTTCIEDKCWLKISQLDLSSNRNVGSTSALIAALGNCKQLERLELENCDLSSESINGLTACINDNCWGKLSQLNLSRNRNVGSTSALFTELCNCKQLERLELENCDLSSESINGLTTCINDNCWGKLSQLNLSRNRNVGSTSALFTALCNCKQLERLELQNCDLSSESVNLLTTCINDNCWEKLSQLNLSRNSNVGSTSALIAALGNCKHLERLELKNCDLSIESINRLSICIDDNCWGKLNQLNLSRNSNVGSTPALNAALGNCKQLERLELENCDLSSELINRLTTCIDDTCWVKLCQLSLSYNSNIGSTPALLASLGKLKQLERLSLQRCDLSFESINRLTTCIEDKCWLKISQLDLSSNRNVGSTSALITALGNCKQLERLELQNCDLSSESVNELTTCINDNCWGKLSQLNLSRNSNVGSTPALIAALGNCKQLERLELQNCDLLIESINQLLTCIDDNCWVKLSQLSLSLNSDVGLTPALLAALGKCKQLERIDLQNCYLSIEAMNRLTTCINDNCWVKLSQLDLSWNSNVGLTPALFAALGNCKLLERLDLQNCYVSIEAINRLTTCINDNCWVKLSQLDLSWNINVGLTPALFAALGKCKQLERIDLQNCYLSVEAINRLTTCINNNCWEKLSQFNLSRNSNKCWEILSQLNLSRNSNVGSTPALIAALGNCKQLERLELQNCDLSIESINRLSTCIDDNCWVNLRELGLSGSSNVGSTSALFSALCNCKQLERLNLQNCDLSSELINRLTTCINDNCWLKLSQLDLSWNSNVGSMPALFAALFKCKQLERLGLQRCDLSFESINRLTTCINDECWLKISQLDLSSNRNVVSTSALITALGNCKQLERLELQNCDLSIESINRLSTCIDDNCWGNLRQLGLSGSIIVGSTSALFSALGKCKQLERIDLQNCYLSIEAINRLTTCINNNCWGKLNQLNLSRNSNVGSTPALIAALGNCKQLERLKLQNCDLSSESINRLTTCINDNCWVKLNQLDLSWNSNVGLTPALFTALGKCKQLERIDLQNCYLSIEAINRLTTCIYNNCWEKLSQFNLSRNSNKCWEILSLLNLSRNSNVGSTPALIAALGNCKQLERLELQNCNLLSESVNRLTTCTNDNCWGKLSQLNLSRNSNVGSTPALIAALGNCKQLERLELQNCDLSIESINRLSTCIADNCWVNLRQLGLSGSSNVGSTSALFSALGNCKRLERLDLQNCDLSSELINRLSTCIDDNCWVKLSQLSLSYNSNVGSTPALFAALGKCKQLERLDLQRCDLSFESINRLITCIKDKCWLKLSQFVLSSNNNVDSTLALFAALSKCKHLERLDLRWCDLSIKSINQLTTCIDDKCWLKSKVHSPLRRNALTNIDDILAFQAASQTKWQPLH